MTRYLWITLAACGIAAGQGPTGVATPTLGYIYDVDAQGIRPLEGVPGAAVLGGALHLDSLFEAVTVAPTRKYAFGQESGSNVLSLVRLDGRTGMSTKSEIQGGRVYFSPSGSSVVVVRGNHIEAWTGLPDRATQAHAYDASLGEIEKAAVSDDGAIVVALSGGTLWRMDESPVKLGEGYRDIQFTRNTQDLMGLSAQGLTMYRKASEDSVESLVSLEAEVTTFAVSRDENLVALLGTDSILVIRLDTKEMTPVALEGREAAGLWRAEGNAVFQLTAGMADEIWLLDADSGGGPRLTLVENRSAQEAQ